MARKNLDGIIVDAEYLALRDEVDAERATVRAAIEDLEAETVRAAGDVVEAARDLLADWDLLAVAARREALKRLIRRVEVTTGPHPIVLIDPLDAS